MPMMITDLKSVEMILFISKTTTTKAIGHEDETIFSIHIYHKIFLLAFLSMNAVQLSEQKKRSVESD